MRGAGTSILTRWGHLRALWRSPGFSHQPRSDRARRALKLRPDGLALSRSLLSVHSSGHEHGILQTLWLTAAAQRQMKW